MNTTTTEITIEPCVRRRNPIAPLPVLASEARGYLRRLREAEMAAWERTGGDYLLSKCVNRLKRDTGRLNSSIFTPIFNNMPPNLSLVLPLVKPKTR